MAGGAAPSLLRPRTGSEEVKVIGVRRVIAQRMTDAARTIPHFSYVEEVDVTELESLRTHLNARAPKGTPALTYLPFLAAALARVLEEFPQCNAHYDAERNVLIRHRPVHLGVATQTPDGLKVPVVRHAEARTLWDLSDEIRRVSEAAKSNKASREELSGSTITITSLGRMGGIVSTLIIDDARWASSVSTRPSNWPFSTAPSPSAASCRPSSLFYHGCLDQLRRRRDAPGAQGPAEHPAYESSSPGCWRPPSVDPSLKNSLTTTPAARPAFGTAADQTSIATTPPARGQADKLTPVVPILMYRSRTCPA